MKGTLEAIRALCEEEGDCTVWTGGCNGSGIPYASCDGKTKNLRRHIWALANPDKPVPAGKFLLMKCRNHLCLDPAHMVIKSRKEIGAVLSKEGAYTRPEVIAKKIAKRRAVSKVLTLELAQEIRNADTTAKVEAERRGLSVSMIHGIRQGRFWADRPMHMPVNSVFQLGARSPVRKSA
jgi:hypothetical protein